MCKSKLVRSYVGLCVPHMHFTLANETDFSNTLLCMYIHPPYINILQLKLLPLTDRFPWWIIFIIVLMIILIIDVDLFFLLWWLYCECIISGTYIIYIYMYTCMCNFVYVHIRMCSHVIGYDCMCIYICMELLYLILQLQYSSTQT